MLQILLLEMFQYVQLWKVDKGKERMYKMTKCNFQSRDHILLQAFTSSSSAQGSSSALCPIQENTAHMGQLHQLEFGIEKKV